MRGNIAAESIACDMYVWNSCALSEDKVSIALHGPNMKFEIVNTM